MSESSVKNQHVPNCYPNINIKIFFSPSLWFFKPSFSTPVAWQVQWKKCNRNKRNGRWSRYKGHLPLSKWISAIRSDHSPVRSEPHCAIPSSKEKPSILGQTVSCVSKDWEQKWVNYGTWNNVNPNCVQNIKELSAHRFGVFVEYFYFLAEKHKIG